MGMSHSGKSTAVGGSYWTNVVAMVRSDNSYLGELPPRVRRMARWLLAHDNKDKLKGE